MRWRCAREDRGIVLPTNLKGGAAHKLVAKLMDLGLIEEVRARGDLPVWRHRGIYDGCRFILARLLVARVVLDRALPSTRNADGRTLARQGFHWPREEAARLRP